MIKSVDKSPEFLKSGVLSALFGELRKEAKEKKFRSPYYPPTKRRTAPKVMSARGRRARHVSHVSRGEQQSEDDGGGGDCGPCGNPAHGAVFHHCTFYLSPALEAGVKATHNHVPAERTSYMNRKNWEQLYIADPDPEWAKMGVGIFDFEGLFDRNGLEAPILDIFALLEVSPQKFIDILNAPRESSAHLVTNYEPEFRKVSNEKEFFMRGWIFGGSDILVHEEDFKDWLDNNYMLLKAWRKNEKEIHTFIDRVESQEILEEIEAAHGEWSTEFEALRAENEKLRARVAELENAVQNRAEVGEEGEEFPTEYENHGIFTMVAKLAYARAPLPEIMRAVDNEKVFLSQREAGYFFHPIPEGKATSTLRNYQKNHKAK